MEGFERAADFPERLSHVYSAIAQELEGLGVTTLYTTETRELFSRSIQVPINGLSAATQNIILMRHIEHRASMLRVMVILKVRDDDYDARMREIQITDAGIRLLDTFAAELQVASGGGVSNEMRLTDAGSSGAVSTAGSILIVDDEFGLAEMLRDMLRDYDYDVSVAINGRLALDILKERPIGLVITDMMMPVMDGVELASAMRESESVSPHSDRDDDVASLRHAASECALRRRAQKAVYAGTPAANRAGLFCGPSPRQWRPAGRRSEFPARLRPPSQTVTTDHRSSQRRSEQ